MPGLVSMNVVLLLKTRQMRHYKGTSLINSTKNKTLQIYAFRVPFVPLRVPLSLLKFRDLYGEPSWNRQSQNCENGSDFLYTQNRIETV